MSKKSRMELCLDLAKYEKQLSPRVTNLAAAQRVVRSLKPEDLIGLLEENPGLLYYRVGNMELRQCLNTALTKFIKERL